MDIPRGLDRAEERIRARVPADHQQSAIDAIEAAKARFANLDTSEADRREATHQRGEDIAAQVHQRIDAAWARVQPMIDHANQMADNFRSSHPAIPVATPGGGGTGAPLQGSTRGTQGTQGTQGTASVSSNVSSTSNTGQMSTQTASSPSTGGAPPPRTPEPFKPFRWWT